MKTKGNLDSVLDKLFFTNIVFLPFTFAYSTFGLFNIVVILTTVLWLYRGGISNLVHALHIKLVLLFISTYLIYAVWLLQTDDIKVGGFLLEKKLALLLFPVMLSSIKINQTIFNNILKSFIISCFIATLLSAVHVLLSLDDPMYATTDKTDWFRERFTEFLDLHPTYFSIYIVFSIVILLLFLFREWGSMKVIMRLSTMALLFYFLSVSLLLSARTPLAVLFLFIIVAYYKFWLKNKLVASVCIVLGLGIVFYLFSEVHFFKRRFSEIQETKWAPPVGIYHNSTNLRAGIYHCALPLLKEHWLWGLGTGNVQSHLNNCYKTNGFSEVMYLDEYNTHNEYLNVWLNTGIIGIALFLSSLFIPFWLSIKSKNYLYIAFLCLMMLVFLTENVLERQKGVIFFAFFNSLLAFYPHHLNLFSIKNENQ